MLIKKLLNKSTSYSDRQKKSVNESNFNYITRKTKKKIELSRLSGLVKSNIIYKIKGIIK